MKSLLPPLSALLWGFQYAFLSPALALILVALYGVSTSQVGWIIAVYNVGALFAALLMSSAADRLSDYLRPMLACSALTLLLVAVLAGTASLPLVVLALFLFCGPASVGLTMLFAYLRYSGAPAKTMINTRAIVSASWVAGTPVMTMLISVFGHRSILVSITITAILGGATTLVMLLSQPATLGQRGTPEAWPDDHLSFGNGSLTLVVGAFVLLYASSFTALAVLTLFVAHAVGLPVVWAGVALSVAAALEVPCLIVLGRLSRRFSNLALVITGCISGFGGYLATAFVTGPVLLLIVQPLNAWRTGAISGVGLPLFQQLVRRPGLSSGLFTNVQRVGAILTGPIIAFGSSTGLAERGIFLTCALLSLCSLVALAVVSLCNRRPR